MWSSGTWARANRRVVIVFRQLLCPHVPANVDRRVEKRSIHCGTVGSINVEIRAAGYYVSLLFDVALLCFKSLRHLLSWLLLTDPLNGLALFPVAANIGILVPIVPFVGCVGEGADELPGVAVIRILDAPLN